MGNGCAGISTYPASPQQSNGIRIFPQKIYLFVDVDMERHYSKLVSLPDLKNAYDVKPWSFLSKHDFTITIEEAQVKVLTSNQDSSAALSLLQKIVELAGEAAKLAVQPSDRGLSKVKAAVSIDIPGYSFGLKTGIYELSETGVFKKVSP
jgi:hypothetical protein